jgi:DNA adenine methylase
MLINLLKEYPETSNALRIANSFDGVARPFLQWVGGKREMINQYQGLLPNKFKKYYEPFLGGGAMFFYLRPKHAILLDINRELVVAYKGIKQYSEEVVEILKSLKSKHSKVLYDRIRSLDREFDIFTELSIPELTARMIYLNQTCFNGLYRVNKKGEFNVPIGSSLNRLICDEKNILSVSEALKNIEIQCGDFTTILDKLEGDDFVYLDPPYYPVSQHSDFTRYSKEKFYIEDQVRLKEFVDTCTKKGVKVMLSNSNSEFINDLYKDYLITEVNSSRNLNCKKTLRGKVSEVVVINYKI